MSEARATIGDVKSGIFLPPFGELASPRRVADLAAAAEEAGWDGWFIWDHMLAMPGLPVGEAWTTLAAVATATSAIRLGALVTPLARRRPWTLARQIATLDGLSGGRLVVGIGLGDDGWREFSSFGEQTDPRLRGRLLDESLDVLLAFLSGNAVSYQGTVLRIDSAPLLPRPVQDPVPIWAACVWPHRRPLARAARVQGCFPIFPGTGPVRFGPAEIEMVRAELTGLGAPRSHDVVVCGATRRLPDAARADAVLGLRDAGVTWLLESFPPEVSAAEVEEVVRAGPHLGGQADT
jgi:alkanesulfonate monooxygenase SsuD/methylene tetrahydromethanopterin reductase-like flavin-dependent oxidoreductase (luciferase family)